MKLYARCSNGFLSTVRCRVSRETSVPFSDQLTFDAVSALDWRDIAMSSFGFAITSFFKEIFICINFSSMLIEVERHKLLLSLDSYVSFCEVSLGLSSVWVVDGCNEWSPLNEEDNAHTWSWSYDVSVELCEVSLNLSSTWIVNGADECVFAGPRVGFCFREM